MIFLIFNASKKLILPKCFDNYKEDISENELDRITWVIMFSLKQFLFFYKMLSYVKKINTTLMVEKLKDNPDSIIYSDKY